MTDMFAPLIEKLKKEPKTIVFTEGNDPRILEAAARLLKDDILKVVMVGNTAEVKKAAAEGGFDISKAEIADPDACDYFDEMVQKMVELRKGKMTAEECAATLKKSNYFGTMLVKMGKADCLLGGATYSTADTVRPALQLIKTKPGATLVSSCMIMDRQGGEEHLQRIACGDVAINIDYTDTIDKATGEVKQTAAEKLAEVVVATAETAQIFGIDPKVAMMPPSSLRRRLRSSISMASCSSTLLFPWMLPRSSARIPRLQAAQTSSSSRTLSLQTSVIRWHSVSAAMMHTARSFRV